MGWRYIALLGFLKARELLKPEANGYQTALIICILFSCISIPKERNIPEKILLNAYRAVLEAVATRAARFIGDRAGLAATTAVRNRHCHPCPTPSALSTHGITEVQNELEGTHQDPWVHPCPAQPPTIPLCLRALSKHLWHSGRGDAGITLQGSLSQSPFSWFPA